MAEELNQFKISDESINEAAGGWGPFNYCQDCDKFVPNAEYWERIADYCKNRDESFCPRAADC